MKDNLSDTHPKTERVIVEFWRRMSAAEKFRHIQEQNRFLQMLALSDVHQQHPEATEEECRLRVASRSLPADLMWKAFHWDVEKEGY